MFEAEEKTKVINAQTTMHFFFLTKISGCDKGKLFFSHISKE